MYQADKEFISQYGVFYRKNDKINKDTFDLLKEIDKRNFSIPGYMRVYQNRPPEIDDNDTFSIKINVSGNIDFGFGSDTFGGGSFGGGGAGGDW